MLAITILVIDSFLLFIFFYFSFKRSFYELPRIVLDFLHRNLVIIRIGMVPFKVRIKVLLFQQVPERPELEFVKD